MEPDRPGSRNSHWIRPGTYTCTITDFYGCIANTAGTLTQPTALTAVINSNNAKCFGKRTGTVSAIGSGGVGSYTYFWPALSSALSTVNNVAIGVYSCNITDGNSCTVTGTITVTQPTSVTLTSTVTAANCGLANGSVTVSAAGGTTPYGFTWNSGATTSTLSGQFAGTYTVNVLDGNNCMQTLAATIPNTTGPQPVSQHKPT